MLEMSAATIERKENRNERTTIVYEEIARNYDLWEEFVDPDGVDSKQFFDSLSVEQKVKIQKYMFGEDEFWTQSK
jgi:hypothetical protein